MENEKSDTAISVALSKWMLYVFGSLVVASMIGIGGAFFVLYTDVAMLKDNNEKFKQQRQVSVKQWEKLRRLKDKQAKDMTELNKYLYSFHGKDILGIPHDHKDGE